MSAPVFYVPPEQYDAFTPGGIFELAGAEGHHAKVKRLNAGERIDLSDGKGRRALGTVEELLTNGVQVRITDTLRENTTPAVHLVQALAKDSRDLLAIETATELGISGVVPWNADRSIVRWKNERATKAHAKWQNTVVSAAKQSRRSLIPTVYDLHSSTELGQLVANVTQQQAAVFILHEQATEPLTARLGTILAEQKRPQEIYLIVGPEGGITDREVQLLTVAGALTARLGTEVLRSSTAGAAALCTLNVALGRW